MDGCTKNRVSYGLCAMHNARVRAGQPVGSADLQKVPWPTNLVLYSDRSGGPDACWPWLRTITNMGYAQARAPEGRSKYAHIVMYEEHVGPIPDGHDLDHLCHGRDKSCPGGLECRHRRCINPAHLQPVPHRANLQRGRNSFDFNGRCMAQLHDMTVPANVMVDGHGNRRCRPCRHASTLRRDRRIRAERPSAS